MKSAKKILALILAGVMALALLTGCGKATSLNRTMAEGFAESLKSSFANYYNNTNSISVSYQVPELSREIAPLFDENWITKDNSGKDALTNAAKETLPVRRPNLLLCGGCHGCQNPVHGNHEFEQLADSSHHHW